MIPLLQTKTVDTAHMRIFASVTRPFFPIFGEGLGTRLASSCRTYNPINDKAWSTLD